MDGILVSLGAQKIQYSVLTSCPSSLFLIPIQEIIFLYLVFVGVQLYCNEACPL